MAVLEVSVRSARIVSTGDLRENISSIRFEFFSPAIEVLGCLDSTRSFVSLSAVEGEEKIERRTKG